MFKFLKEKLSKAVSIFSKRVEESSEEVVEEKPKKTEEVKESKKEKIIKKKEIKEKKTEKPKKKDKKSTKEEKQKKQSKEEKEEAKEEKEEAKEEKEEAKEEELKEEKQGFFKKIFKKKEQEPEEPKEEKEKEEKEEEPKEKPESQPKEEQEQEPKEEPKEEKQGFFKKILKISISDNKFNELFWEIELALLENNVAVEVIEKFKQDLKGELLNKKLSPFKLSQIIKKSFGNTLEELFNVKEIDLISNIKKQKPYTILFVGVNGSGKTTNLAKVAYLLKNKGLKPVIAACDTFRAAALHQLEEHCNNLGIKLIKHDYGSDAAAVAFDAIKHAESKNLDVVLIDTAGRSHSNVNLMDELKKIERVSKPHLTVFVGDSLTGNDVVEQARAFNESVGIDAIILSKVDVDEKGGAAISVSHITGKPIIYIGSGQEYKDLKEFDKELVINSLGLD